MVRQTSNDQPSRVPRHLLVLAAGAFAIGTDGFLIAGLLPEIGRSLHVSESAAGQLITVFALVYAVGSPLLAIASGRFERRRLLSVVLVCFAAANLLGALAPSYGLLLVARVFAAATAAMFMPNASAIAATTSAPERRGRALAVITGGLTVAVVAGVPLGTLIGALAGWRWSLGFVAALSMVVAALVHTMLPKTTPPPPAGLRQRVGVLRRPAILRVIAPTITYFTAGFAVYSYIAVVAKRTAGLGASGVAAMLLAFGIAAIAGNAAGGRASDRLGPETTLKIAVGGLAVALGLLAFTSALEPGRRLGLVLTLAGVLLWGLFGWAVNAPQQSLLVRGAADQPAVALSLSGSANYIGIALGSALGGLLLRTAGVTALALSGAGLAAAALALLVAAPPQTTEARSLRQPAAPK